MQCDIEYSYFQVMEMLVHVNKRLKSRPKIQLPVKDLLAQYQDPQVSQFVTVSMFRLSREFQSQRLL